MGDQSQNLELQVAVNNGLMRKTESGGHIPLLLIDISSMLIAFPPLWIDILPMWINIAPLWIDILPMWISITPLWIDIPPMWISITPLRIDIHPMLINIAPLWIGKQVLRLLLPEEWPDLNILQKSHQIYFSVNSKFLAQTQTRLFQSFF